MICCICFDSDKTVRCCKNNHYFHKDCFDKYTIVYNYDYCPLCKTNDFYFNWLPPRRSSKRNYLLKHNQKIYDLNRKWSNYLTVKKKINLLIELYTYLHKYFNYLLPQKKYLKVSLIKGNEFIRSIDNIIKNKLWYVTRNNNEKKMKQLSNKFKNIFSRYKSKLFIYNIDDN